MSKYESVCKAIGICESARRLFSIDSTERRNTNEAIRDLQEIARDVRYGGKWEGDFESVAESLDYCAENMCGLCLYKKIQDSECRRTSKKDAAAVIRQLVAMLKAKDETIAAMAEQIEEMRGDAFDSDYQPTEPTEPAEWQKEIMEAVKEGKLPY